MNRHLVPGLGKHRLDKIGPEHFEKLYARIVPAVPDRHRSSGAPTARTAFGEALRRGHIVRNPVALAKAPRVEEEEVDPFEIAEIRQLITAALNRRNGVRFVLALAIGTRQGETIGLKWNSFNPDTSLLRIARQLQRQTWEHGCSDPDACGEHYHKIRPCPPAANGTRAVRPDVAELPTGQYPPASFCADPAPRPPPAARGRLLGNPEGEDAEVVGGVRG